MFAFVTAALLTLGAAAPVLTLEDALKAAQEGNLDLQAAQQKLAQAREISSKLNAAYLPQIGLGAQYTYNNVDDVKLKLPTGYYIREIVNPATGQPVPQGPKYNPDGEKYDPKNGTGLDNPPGAQTPYIMLPSGMTSATIQAQNQVGGALTLNQAILAPSLITGMKAAGFGVTSAELNIESARREILFGVAQLYYGAVSAREAIKVQNKLLEANVAHEKDAEARVNAGAMPKVVLLRARIDRVRNEQDVVRAQNTYTSLKSSLSVLLNRAEDFDVTQPGEPVAPAVDETDAAKTIRNRPDVRAAEASVESADWGTLTPKMKYLPSIGLSGRVQYSNVGGFAGQNTTWNIGVGLNWNLFDGGLREAEIREAASKLEEARLTERSTELKAQDELRRAKLDLESALANRRKAAEQLELAKENARLVQASFGAGAGTYIEVSDAASALTGAELAQLAETLNAQLAVLRLAKAAGAFDPK